MMPIASHERARRDSLARYMEAHPFHDPRICPVCKRRMKVFHASHNTPEVSAHCLNRGCKLYSVTLPLGSHQRLTPAQIEAYAAMNARQRERMERWLSEMAESMHGEMGART